MKWKIKDELFKIQSISILIYLPYWYVYYADHTLDKDNDVKYKFLCFTLCINLKKIDNKKIGFK